MSRNSGDDWKSPIAASVASRRTVNPIRSIVDNLKVQPNPQKPMISLALGDPTTFGNFKTAAFVVEEMTRQLQSYRANGYPPSTGYETARAAIAKAFTLESAPLTAKDVVIASGCSGALELCISVIANEGDNILMPRPGFSLYQTLAQSKGIECRYYDLLPEKSWEINLSHLSSLVDGKTRAIVVNNPSNPCGSVYSKQHLLDILATAWKHRLPIIADEIYAEMAFQPHQFIPMASLTNDVPILAVGGLAKRFLVPGWRVGWILIHDRHGLFQEIRPGLNSLSQLILGANSVVQCAIPAIFEKTPPSFFQDTMKQLEENASLSAKLLAKIPGLRVIFPQGAMYIMVEILTDRFADIKNDLEFSEKLVAEESVLCLPGQCFQMPNYFRIVFTAPAEQLEAAFTRMQAFCERHLKK